MNDSQGTARGGGISRRAFLSGTGAAAAATALGQQTEPAKKAAVGEGTDAGQVSRPPGVFFLCARQPGSDLPPSVFAYHARRRAMPVRSASSLAASEIRRMLM